MGRGYLVAITGSIRGCYWIHVALFSHENRLAYLIRDGFTWWCDGGKTLSLNKTKLVSPSSCKTVPNGPTEGNFREMELDMVTSKQLRRLRDAYHVAFLGTFYVKMLPWHYWQVTLVFIIVSSNAHVIEAKWSDDMALTGRGRILREGQQRRSNCDTK